MKEEQLSPWQANLDLNPSNSTNAVCFLKETANKLLTICHNENADRIKKRLSKMQLQKSRQTECINLKKQQKKMRYISQCEQTQTFPLRKSSKHNKKQQKQVSLLPQFGLYKTTIVHKTFLLENINYSRRYCKDKNHRSSKFQIKLASLQNKERNALNQSMLTGMQRTTGVRGLNYDKMERYQRQKTGIKKYNLFKSSNWQ